jgi:hypothetical protein
MDVKAAGHSVMVQVVTIRAVEHLCVAAMKERLIV